MAGLKSSRWALLLLAWLHATTAAAQIINVQGLFDENTGPGRSAAVDLGADWRTGSIDLFSLRGALVGQWRTENHTWMGVVRGEYAFAADEVIVSKVLEHVRYRYQFTERLSGEAFLQHEFDEFRRIQFRALLGAGPRVKLLTDKKATLVVGLALMLEHERIRRDAEPDAGTFRTDPRLSSYILGRLELMENVALVQTLYAQPRVTNFADVRLLNDTIFEVKPNERLTVSIGFNLAFDNSPPLAVPKLDTQLRTSVGIRL
ncbi:DUF481 domain-containing protein [Myxococcus sp. AM009]|uniref:DUF481 domain-containing protein n=1 Tax=unclassified Myxococcus TaxID=2648731 RepID=UPI0015960A1C|nr:MULTISPECIES: DUF481 domain-containing protein [unclassified Myxococcus]NVI99661.1 DUF481 domain-containing protein [Myxococcus sp. AM009]NVJ15807.1 DUF481 domain-containing protein [Myxococcus sp. AM010]